MEAPPHTNRESTLQQKVEVYKNLGVLLKWVARCILLLTIIYAILPFLDKGAHYKSLDNKTVVGELIDVNSFGNLIACSAYGVNDSSVSILVSSDSGRHFELVGGPWKGTLEKISIAPDNESIVAFGGADDIYLRPAGNKIDSFLTIHLRGNVDGVILSGFCFVPQTDSVYFFGMTGNVVGLDYKKSDSFMVAHLHNISNVYSMSISAQKEIVLLGNRIDESNYNGALVVDNYFDQVKRYAAAEVRTNSTSPTQNQDQTDPTAKDTDNSKLPVADSSIQHVDTTISPNDAIQRPSKNRPSKKYK
jgi:hypothetical protein